MTKQSSAFTYSRQKARKIMGVVTPNLVVHHKDRDPLNNDRSNLVIMANSDHSSLHANANDIGWGKYWGFKENAVARLEKLLMKFNYRIF